MHARIHQVQSTLPKKRAFVPVVGYEYANGYEYKIIETKKGKE